MELYGRHSAETVAKYEVSESRDHEVQDGVSSAGVKTLSKSENVAVVQWGAAGETSETAEEGD